MVDFRFWEEDKQAQKWLEEQSFRCKECDEYYKFKNMKQTRSGAVICKECSR